MRRNGYGRSLTGKALMRVSVLDGKHRCAAYTFAVAVRTNRDRLRTRVSVTGRVSSHVSLRRDLQTGEGPNLQESEWPTRS